MSTVTYLGERADIPKRGPGGGGWEIPDEIMRSGGGARWIEEQHDATAVAAAEALARQQQRERMANDATALAAVRREIDDLRQELEQRAEVLDPTERLAALEERFRALEERQQDPLTLEAGTAALALAGGLERARSDIRTARETWATEREAMAQEVRDTQTLMSEARTEAGGWFSGLQDRFQAAVAELRSWAEEQVMEVLRAVPVPVGLAGIEQPADDRLLFKLTDGTDFTARLARGPRGYEGQRGRPGQASVAAIGGGGTGLASLAAAVPMPITIGTPVPVNTGPLGDSSVFLCEISTPAGEKSLTVIWTALASQPGNASWTIAPEITSAGFPAGITTTFGFSKVGIGGSETQVTVTASGGTLPAGSKVKIVAVATVK